MAENILRNTGRAAEFKTTRGGAPSETGPFVGIVKNNVDPTRSGRLQVFITELSAGAADTDPANWRTVSYLSPFYGVTQHSGTPDGEGGYVGNRHSYGMWFTPPDLETKVLCFFAAGDPNQGYYLGCIPEPGLTHMVPAIGAVENAKRDNAKQESLFGGATRLPVAEINDKNDSIADDPRFHDKTKPVHSYAAGILFQQGLINDRVRGPIGSSSQRESPSAVYGISTPGRAIYEAGLSESNIRQQLAKGELKPHDVKILGRRGGHTFVMDDGDLEGNDALIRIRTSRGHQLIMSDDGDCFHFIHANGQSWIEMGKEGVIDMYSTNSINLRSQGELNFHADKSINFFAGENIQAHAVKNVQVEAQAKMNLIANSDFTVHTSAKLGMLANGALAIKGDTSVGIAAGGTASVIGAKINLNSGGSASVAAPQKITKTKLSDTEFSSSKGWEIKPAKLTSIVSRAPTHEPYSEHNKGVDVKVTLAPATSTTPSPPPPAQEKLAATEAAPVALPVAVSDFANTEKATAAIGSIAPDQFTGMLAQKAKSLGQSLDTVGLETGIGKFGIGLDKLEELGYLKPGTLEMAKALPGEIKDLMESANRWTLKGGIDSIEQLLASEKLQVSIQQEVAQQAHKLLEQTGVLQGIEDVKQVAGLLSAAIDKGPQMAVDWANGKVTELTEQINSIVNEAQKAVEFVTKKLPDSLADAQGAVSKIATTAREGVDSTVNEIIGNAKIPAVVYQVAEDGEDLLDQAGDALKAVSEEIGGVLAKAQQLADKATEVANAASGAVTGAMSGLTSTAAGLTTEATSAVAGVLEQASNTANTATDRLQSLGSTVDKSAQQAAQAAGDRFLS